MKPIRIGSDAPAKRARSTRSTATPAVSQSYVPLRPAKSNLALKEKNVKKPPKDPPSDNINQYPYYAGPDPISGWSVELLASALGQHQRGMFQPEIFVSKLFEEFKTTGD